MREFELQEIKFYVGQNAKENWDLLDRAKVENQNYIWFHLDSFPSPYVIMWSTIGDLEKMIKEADKLDNITIDQFINYGANLCKEYSKYKFLKDLKIMYTTVNKLTKTDTVGEVDIKGKRKILKVVETPATPP